MPLAATGLVICWNFPMNRARLAFLARANPRLLEQGCRHQRRHRRRPPFRGLHRLVDEAVVVIAHGLVRTVGTDIGAIDREARDHFLDRRNQAVEREVAEVAVPFGEAIQLVSERIDVA
jgi:hypothetical protein